MVLVQIDLNQEENKVVKQYMLDNDVEDKRVAIKQIIMRFQFTIK